jgi:hypothetical protein
MALQTTITIDHRRGVEAQGVCDAWRQDYNQFRLDNAVQNRTPVEWAARMAS